MEDLIQVKQTGADTTVRCSKEVKSIYIEFSDYKVKELRIDLKGK